MSNSAGARRSAAAPATAWVLVLALTLTLYAICACGTTPAAALPRDAPTPRSHMPEPSPEPAMPTRAPDAPATSDYAMALFRVVAKDPGNLVFSLDGVERALAQLSAVRSRPMRSTLGEHWAVAHSDDRTLHSSVAPTDLQVRTTTRLFLRETVDIPASVQENLIASFGSTLVPLSSASSEEPRRRVASTLSAEVGEPQPRHLMNVMGPDPGLVSATWTVVRVKSDAAFDHGRVEPRSWGYKPWQSATRVMSLVAIGEHLPYARTASAKLLELPLGEALSLLLVTPVGGDLDRLVSRLDRAQLTRWRAALRLQPLAAVSIPMLRLTRVRDLTGALGEVGLEGLLDPSGYVTRPPVALSNFVHGGSLEIRHAARPMLGKPGAYVGLPMASFLVPFLFVVFETRSGRPTTLGLVRDPGEATTAQD